jgi:hypothetical protein
LKRLFILNIGLLVCFFSIGQTTTTDSTDLGDYTISTIYKPDVAESHKIGIEPSLEDPKVNPPEYAYRFPNIAYKPKPVYSPIDPVFIKKEEPKDLFDNYIEIGGGNYLTSYVDASIHNTRDKYYTYGLRIKHHAASSSKNPNQALFSQNRITAFGTREKGNDLTGEIDYQRNVVHYYGYMQETDSFELGDINQIYNDINANAIWSFKKRKIKSDLGFAFNIFDNLGENESTFDLSSDNEFKVGKNKFHLDLAGRFTQLTEAAKYDRLFIDINPHYEFKYKKYFFDLGLLANYFNDSNTNQLYLAPSLKAETYLVPDKLRAYAGITGGLQQNTLRTLAYENLFFGYDSLYNNPRSLFNIYAGMNGNFKRFVEYGIKLSQENIRDQYFFVNDTNSLRNFTTVYDDISRFTFSGELKFDVNQNVDLGFRGNFYSYSTNKEKEAWHMPSYDAALFATVRLADKIYINGGYFATSSRKSRDLAGNEFNLAAINDINIGAEYRYKKNISGFININNILNQRYELYKFYSAQGLNVLAGVTFSL